MVIKMVNEVIISKKLPRMDLPFSHGFSGDNLVFTSGQVGTNPKTGKLAKGIEAQTRQTLENVEAVLETAGCSRKEVVKATVFLADIRDYTSMNKVYGSFFSKPYPARSCVEARLANPRILVEIEVVACR